MSTPATSIDLLSVSDLATLFQVRKRKVYDLVRDAGLPHVRIGRVLRFRGQDVDAWLRAQTVDVPRAGRAQRTHPLSTFDWSTTKEQY